VRLLLTKKTRQENAKIQVPNRVHTCPVQVNRDIANSQRLKLTDNDIVITGGTCDHFVPTLHHCRKEISSEKEQ
jgi:hypothetical protein